MLLGILANQGTAAAEHWVWESGEAEDRALSRLRFATRANVWMAEFNRPARACRPPSFGFFPGVAQELRSAQAIPGAFCQSEGSAELGLGPGLELSFRVAGPVYLAAGVDLLYTTPASAALKHQVVLAVPMSVMLTWYPWALRPIAQATITPVLYLTDDARDYTLGGAAGLALRLMSFGDLSLTVGYHGSETVQSWTVQIGVHPLPSTRH